MTVEPTSRFNVFGRVITTQRTPTGAWQVWRVGNDGKRAPANFVIPDFMKDEELEQYLFDLFHEDAAGANTEVRRLA